MTSIVLKLPVPPSANAMFITFHGRGGAARAKSSDYKKWLREALQIIGIQTFPATTLSPPYSISMDIPRNRRRDLDNHIKPLLDMLVKARIIIDDRYIDSLSIRYVDGADLVMMTINTDV